MYIVAIQFPRNIHAIYCYINIICHMYEPMYRQPKYPHRMIHLEDWTSQLFRRIQMAAIFDYDCFETSNPFLIMPIASVIYENLCVDTKIILLSGFYQKL